MSDSMFDSPEEANKAAEIIADRLEKNLEKGLLRSMMAEIKKAVDLGTKNGSVENGLLEIIKWNPLTIKIRTLEGEKIVSEVSNDV